MGFKNRERAKEYYRDYYQRNKEKIYNQHRNYYEKTKEKWKIYGEKYGKVYYKKHRKEINVKTFHK